MSKPANFTRSSLQPLRPAALLLAAAWAISGLVQAAEGSPAASAASAPAAERSRAEVVAELVKARVEGQMPADNEVDPFTTQRRAEAKQRDERRLAALKTEQASMAGKTTRPQ